MDNRPADLMSIQAELALDQGLFEGEKAEILRKLTPAWKIKPAETQALGDAWVKAGSGLAKPVPSAVIDGEWNVQLNPLRADMALLRVIEVKPFLFDERMYK
jgi:RES domain-containing protein